jgi:DNA-binding FrmR family transcriptional regulator
MSQPNNPAHDAIAKRLARIAGHAASLKRLWEERYDNDEILIQIAAVRAALDQVGRLILEHHIDECVIAAVTRGEPDEAIADLKAALERFIK